jgi:nitroreductase
MDIFDVIRGRRSIRAYQSKPVDKEKIRRLLESAILAPSEGNLQSWKFFVVENDEKRRELVKAAGNQTFISEAPVAIVVCTDSAATAPYGIRGKTLYCIQTSGAAVQNILLSAYAMGLGTCWVGAFREEEVSKSLGLPNHLRPVAIIPVGYPAENPEMRKRKTLEEVVEYV